MDVHPFEGSKQKDLNESHKLTYFPRDKILFTLCIKHKEMNQEHRKT